MGLAQLRLLDYQFGSMQNRACCLFNIKCLRLNKIKEKGFDHILVCKSIKNTSKVTGEVSSPQF